MNYKIVADIYYEYYEQDMDYVYKEVESVCNDCKYFDIYEMICWNDNAVHQADEYMTYCRQKETV